MALSCRHVWDRISEYIDDTLDPQVRAEVERHLAHCEICSAIIDSTRNIIIFMAATPLLICPSTSANAFMPASTTFSSTNFLSCQESALSECRAASSERTKQKKGPGQKAGTFSS